MSLTVNRTEEKEVNWADLIDGLRYAGFRRGVSMRGPNSEARNVDEARPARESKRDSSESEPS